MKKIKRFILLLIVAVLILSGFKIKSGYDKYRLALEERPLEDAVASIRDKENYSGYGDVPEIYFKAVVAFEDRRFYSHKGFDPIGTARAIYRDIASKKPAEGGSTISQQLAKNMYFPADDTLQRKIAEIFMACRIEKEYTKEEILELYANVIYYGSGYYCIYDASKGYFKKPPSDMTDNECTLLAGIPNAPSVYSLDVNPELAKQQQKKVIKAMVECGYINDESEILLDE